MSSSSPKTAIVTQAGHPILAAVARRLARSGVQVVACDVEPASTDRLTEEGDDSVIGFTGDVARREEADRLVALAVERFGAVDILINGPVLPAGIDRPFGAGALLEAGTAALGAWANAVEAVEPVLARGGRIVSLVTSAGQYRTGYFLPEGQIQSAAPEAMANGAILGLTRQLALELAPRGIRVNAVVMGLMEGSEAFERMNERERRYVMEEISLGRLATPEDVAAVIAFLASGASNYVTGDAIDVNGGWWMS